MDFLGFSRSQPISLLYVNIAHISLWFAFDLGTELDFAAGNLDLDFVDSNKCLFSSPKPAPIYMEHSEAAIKIFKEGEEIFCMQQRFPQNVNFCQISACMHRCLLTDFWVLCMPNKLFTPSMFAKFTVNLQIISILLFIQLPFDGYVFQTFILHVDKLINIFPSGKYFFLDLNVG